MFTVIAILVLQNIGVITAQPIVVNALCASAIVEQSMAYRSGFDD